MDTLLLKSERWSLYLADARSLREVSRFVVDENYEHHKEGNSEKDKNLEYHSVYQTELQLAQYSYTIIARDNNDGRLIGCIRSTYIKGNNIILPMQQIFGHHIVKLDCLRKRYGSLWHIGRFAISKRSEAPLFLFQRLMYLAINPICLGENGLVLAEVDTKLLHTMSLLLIKAEVLAEGVEYLGSMTIPVQFTREGLMLFYLKMEKQVSQNHFFSRFELQANNRKSKYPKEYSKVPFWVFPSYANLSNFAV